jgi:excisionase family DNA binding protein
MAELLSADDVAAMLGIGRDWVYAEVRANRIPHIRLGRYVRFRAESIEEWIAGLERATMNGTTKRRGYGLEPPRGMAQEGNSHTGQP